MNELDRFAVMYIMMMRDPVITTMVNQMKESSFSFSDQATKEAYSAMNQAQHQAVYELLLAAVDVSMFSWLTMTSQEFGPWSLVNRDKATNVGLSSVTNGLDLQMTKPMEWIQKYSEFRYEEQNPWSKYGWPGEPGSSLN